MGGGLGLGDLLGIVKQVDKYLINNQFIIACGKNEELFDKAKQLKTNNIIKVIPYVDNISQYMKCSDIIVTKPGGITVTEAMILGKPLALISPIPGQERHNESYLLNQGVAISLPSNRYGGIILSNLMKNKKRMEVMAQLQSLLTNANATRDIVNDLLQLAKAKS
jgi:processive 1,2-diacylglycerol beta-glucosyltransferase